MTNPKSIAFFTAFLPQFLDPTLPVERQLLVMCICSVTLGGILDSGWAVAAGFGRAWFMKPQHNRLLGRLSGLVLIGGGIWLSLARRPGLRRDPKKIDLRSSPNILLAHDLFRKPVPTFRDHARGSKRRFDQRAQFRRDLGHDAEPRLESGPRLVEQHAQSVHRLVAALARAASSGVSFGI